MIDIVRYIKKYTKRRMVLNVRVVGSLSEPRYNGPR